MRIEHLGAFARGVNGMISEGLLEEDRLDILDAPDAETRKAWLEKAQGASPWLWFEDGRLELDVPLSAALAERLRKGVLSRFAALDAGHAGVAATDDPFAPRAVRSRNTYSAPASLPRASWPGEPPTTRPPLAATALPNQSLAVASLGANSRSSTHWTPLWRKA